MIILGIDPGATTGWCLYDSGDRHVIASGSDRDIGVVAELHHAMLLEHVDDIAIERPKGYGPTRPQVVDCAYVCGWIAATLDAHGFEVHELVRRDVCAILTDAVHGVVRVKNDATAWAALVLLHGEGSDRKLKKRKGVVVEEGGAIGGVTSHARAALAVAVAFALRHEVTK